MNQKIIKGLALTLGVFVSAFVLLIAAAYFMSPEGDEVVNPEWMKIDSRFAVPTGYRVVGEGRWLERINSGSRPLPPVSSESRLADLDLEQLKQGLEDILGEKVSRHWLYCARSKVEDDWIEKPQAPERITPLELEQILRAHEICLMERQKRQRDVDSGTPKHYATRSMRADMKEILKSSRGDVPIEAATRQCLRDHRDSDAFTRCMLQKPGATADGAWREWGELLLLMNRVRGEEKQADLSLGGSLQIRSGFVKVNEDSSLPPMCHSGAGSHLPRASCGPTPVGAVPIMSNEVRRPSKEEVEREARFQAFKNDFEALVGAKLDPVVLSCAQNQAVRESWIHKRGAIAIITPDQLDQLMRAHDDCRPKWNHPPKSAVGDDIQYQYAAEAIRTEMRTIYQSRGRDEAVPSGVRDCLRNKNDRDEFVQCIEPLTPGVSLDAIWAEWIGIFDRMLALRRQSPKLSP